MKKTLISVSLLAAMSLSPSAFSVPVEGGHTLQWSGTVPAATDHGDGFFIIKHGTTDFHDGKLILKNNDKEVTLTSSSEIGFKVVKDADYTAGGPAGSYNPTTDITLLDYTATLANLKIGINGLISEEVNPDAPANFVIYANGAPMKRSNEPAPTAASIPTLVKVVQNEAEGVNKMRFKSGDSIVVQAFIKVTAEVV